MADCPNDFDYTLTFTIVGRGKTKADAAKDFNTKLEAKLDELEKKLDCSKKNCEFVPGEDKKECVFDYAEVDKRDEHEVERKLKKHRRKRKHWECIQSFEVGCFCIGNKDEDE